MAKIKRMDQIRNILKIYNECGNIKETSRILKTSKNTIKKYIRILQDRTITPTQALELSDNILSEIIYRQASNTDISRLNYFESQVEFWLTELRRVGVTRQLIWSEYRIGNPDGYSYSQFCQHFKRYVAKKDITIALTHDPGQTMQLDFAGKHMHWIDINSGEQIKCEILIAVFPYSQYTFAIALPSQKIPDFIHGINQSFLFFQGLPKQILCDNLRSYVTRSDLYEPKFTELCKQLGAHFQVDLQATRPRKPKDKASVENAVKIAYNRIYAPLRNEIFFSINELNQAIVKQLEIHNNKKYQKKEGTRFSIFEKHEFTVMRSLPSELFVIKKIVKAKVQRNYHIMLGEDKDFYSVHYSHVGKTSQVVYTTKNVSIYIDNQRVAFHDRLHNNGYKYKTKPEHMPKAHQKWKEIKGYDAQHFLDEGVKIGEATHWAIQRILISRVHEQQAYNSCLGTLQLAKKYTSQRLENAAKRCLIVDKVNYSMLKKILESSLDKLEEEIQSSTIPTNTNVRGADNYK